MDNLERQTVVEAFSRHGRGRRKGRRRALWTKARESAGCVFFRIALLVWSQIFVFRDLLLRMSINGANFWSGSPQ